MTLDDSRKRSDAQVAVAHQDAPPVSVCDECGSDDEVHRGLCRRCRSVLRGEGTHPPAGSSERPHQADPEPLHNPPWRRRGA